MKKPTHAAIALISLSAMSSMALAQQVVKIGHVGPVSGAIAHLGKDNENGARLAIEELNAKNLKIGGQTVKFELLTEDFPELSEPYNNLAALYVDQNELNKARLLLERAIQNRPDYALAHENLADIFTRLAIQSYENAARSNQPSPSVQLKLEHLLKTPAIRSTRTLTNR